VFSAEQDALVEWLQQHQITTVAMEATGIYWLSLYDKLEAAGIVKGVEKGSVRENFMFCGTRFVPAGT
jgi:transposase